MARIATFPLLVKYINAKKYILPKILNYGHSDHLQRG